MKQRRRPSLFLRATFLGMLSAKAGATAAVQDLTSLSIEELAQVEVQSASKRAEPVSEAPTSIFVITGDDILRSAASSLPELLREAPNLQVQRLNARDTPVPYHPKLWAAHRPTPESICDALRKLLSF